MPVCFYIWNERYLAKLLELSHEVNAYLLLRLLATCTSNQELKQWSIQDMAVPWWLKTVPVKA